MANDRFSTVPDDFLHVAESICDYLRIHGFTFAVEKSKIEYPRTPTLVAKRAHTELFIEVTGKFDNKVAQIWARYGHSCDSDVQIALAIPNEPGASQADMEYGTAHRIGIYTISVAGEVTELRPPVDLGFRVELPELQTLPVPVRRIAAPFYQKFEQGDWRDGFADACLAFEQASRKYLKFRCTKPGVSVLDKNGNPISLTAKRINKATLGQLGKLFLRISTPNSVDSTLAKTIPIINQERIAVVHKRGSAAAEKRLRTRTGKQMYAILNCLIELAKTH